MVPADPVPGEILLAALPWTAFSWCPLGAAMGVAEGANPIVEAHLMNSSTPKYLPETLPPIVITLGVRVST